MASTTNSFSALLGQARETSSSASDKKKKKKKSKGKKAVSGDEDFVDTAQIRQELDSNQAVPEPEKLQGNHRSEKESSQAKNSSMCKEGFLDGSAPFTSESAVKHTEKAASATSTADDLGMLWRAWKLELDEVAAGRGVEYTTSKGAMLSFREILLSSSALELSIDPEKIGQNQTVLQDLLSLLESCFGSTATSACEKLVQVVWGFRHLSKSGNSKLRDYARQVVNSAIAVLKDHSTDFDLDDHSWLNHVDKVDKMLRSKSLHLSALMQKSESPDVLMERGKVSSELVHLMVEKHSLPEFCQKPLPSALRTCLNSVRDFKSVLQGMGPRKECTGSTVELQKRRSQVVSQIASLEQQILDLQSDLKGIDAQLTMKKPSQMNATDIEKQLEAIEDMSNLLQKMSMPSSDEQHASKRRLRVDGEGDSFLSAVEQSLQSLQVLQDEKIVELHSLIERLARNKKQSQQLLAMDEPPQSITLNLQRVKVDLDQKLDKLGRVSEEIRDILHCSVADMALFQELVGFTDSQALRASEIEAAARHIEMRHEQISLKMRDRYGMKEQSRSELASDANVNCTTGDVQYHVKHLEGMLEAANANVQHMDVQLAKVNSRAQTGSIGPLASTQMATSLDAPGGKVLAKDDGLEGHQTSGPGFSVQRTRLMEDKKIGYDTGTVEMKPAAKAWGKLDDCGPMVADESLPSLEDSRASGRKRI
uniref:Uncharacterized protein n=1 Tax=Tetraselmis sp. GSL018 TaxID=582737 RepID=A0A061QXV2_9CHLO|mmetsp:Transcript_17365/g.41484  ORF Transcript_17365/g.41484 Transcript_17365/m.41484 type:complete len:706 (-) Transcript_17365:133-2250(-)|eukprot:CAMPEP_0177612142 /NCGR_PEP_ID=MMETSP0419_2-20121207/21008_1 /TAXON_ID=582737 /ORGANISM="Tetraselmis sp., Strain GSL018" /LENGTH=705 /DNA_ID=CAMNT_0019108201 /DNA_START=79 /DNA_END=2196 /DNA_ORIENTATION=+